MFLRLRTRWARGQLDVWTIEVADHHFRIAQPEAPTDFLAHRESGRRGQGDPNAHGECVGLRTETHVVGAEVVTPLTDEMRLVYDEQSRSCTAQRVPRLRVRQLLRRDEDEGVGVAGGEKRLGSCNRRLL